MRSTPISVELDYVVRHANVPVLLTAELAGVNLAHVASFRRVKRWGKWVVIFKMVNGGKAVIEDPYEEIIKAVREGWS